MEIRPYVVFVHFICMFLCISADQLELNGYKISVPRYDNLGMSRPDGQMINLTILGLYEKDQHGNLISTEGHTLILADHTAQNFTTNDPCTLIVQSSNTRARLMDVHSIVDSDAQTVGIGYGLYVMTTRGSLIRGEKELQHVDVNNVKLSLTVDNWKWCAPCEGTDGDSMTGAFLDIIVRLQLPSNAVVDENPVQNGPREIDLGNRMTMYFPKQMMEDGVWHPTTSNYPKVSPTTRPGTHDIAIRMSKFKKIAMYDPVFSLDHDDTDATDSGEELPQCTKDDPGDSQHTSTASTIHSLLSLSSILPILLIRNL